MLLIPKMDYIITTKSNIEFLEETLINIKKQSNVNRIILVVSTNNSLEIHKAVRIWNMLNIVDVHLYEPYGAVSARLRGISKVETEYFVLVDDDVHLKDGWIEEIWPYMNDGIGAVGGRVAYHEKHMKWFSKNKNTISVKIFGRTQNTIIRKETLKGLKYFSVWGIDDNIFFTQYVTSKDWKWLTVPIDSYHVRGCTELSFIVGARGGARHRVMGIIPSWFSICHKFVQNLGGAFKAAYKTRELWFIWHGIKQSIGLVYGFGNWGKYYAKYDFGPRSG